MSLILLEKQKGTPTLRFASSLNTIQSFPYNIALLTRDDIELIRPICGSRTRTTISGFSEEIHSRFEAATSEV